MGFFTFAIVVSLVFIAVAHFAERQYGWWCVCLAAVALAGFSMLIFSPFALMLAVLTLVLCPAAYFVSGGRTGAVTAATVLAVLIAMAISIQVVRGRLAQIEQLAERYPFESLESRLAYESQAGSHEHVAPILPSQVEARVASRERINGFAMRSQALEDLHTIAKYDFAARAGFGVGRMPGLGEYRLRLPPSEPVPLPIPPAASSSTASAEEEGEPSTSLAGARVTALEQLHAHGEQQFISAKRNGFVQSREKVAGFVPHSFQELPKSPAMDDWRVVRLELVSLLRHETPVVYLSDYLPDMKRLEEFGTRPLDAFETSALERLRWHEDLVLDESRNRIRMVGSLRAGNDCSACHGVPRGTLLGAFSYELRRRNPLPPREPMKTPAAWRRQNRLFSLTLAVGGNWP